MAKLARKNQKIFTGNGAAGSMAVFGTMKTGTATYSTDVETLQSTAYTQGWDEAILNDKAPYLEEMNGVQYGLSYQAAYILEQGTPEYSATQTYYKGSICKVISDTNVKLYTSLSDNNVGNAVTDTFNWKPFNLDLYTSTGQNTDGAMTQKAVSDGLTTKLDASTYNNNPRTAGIYLKTAYVNPNVPTSGYNIWSNGFCIQWGNRSGVISNQVVSISLPKTFANTNYCLLRTNYTTVTGSNKYGGANPAMSYYSKSKNSFSVWGFVDDFEGLNWVAIGYLASGQY